MWTPLGTMSLDITKLTFAEVRLRYTSIRPVLVLLRLPVCWVIVVVVVGTWSVLSLVPIAVVLIVVLLNSVSRHRKWSGDSRCSSKKFGFMIQEAFMNLCFCGRSVFAFNLIDNTFILLMKTFKYEFNLIFMINGFSQNCKLIQAGCETL